MPPAELYADIGDGDKASPSSFADAENHSHCNGVEYEVVGQDGEVILRTNRDIIDDAKTQAMSMDEIEILKAEGTRSGKDLIAKILKSHSALDQKTAFGIAKYTLRKAKKYMRRFTVLPMDVPLLTTWIMTEKEPMKVMELREEIMSLIGSWSNVHFTFSGQQLAGEGMSSSKRGRWLMIDETGGLLVADVAEKMGILIPADPDDQSSEMVATPRMADEQLKVNGLPNGQNSKEKSVNKINRSIIDYKEATLAQSNTITLLHANSQPNLSLLRYFGFDAANPSASHPLYNHLKTISWLQLLAPEDDNGYEEPIIVSDETLHSWKSAKRGNYHRKRRRWERIKSIVDETRGGGFDGLIVASAMSPSTILHHTIPLLRGAAQVVIYSPSIEPLTELSDLYSTARRAAFVMNPPDSCSLLNEDFPLNPTLLLAPTIQTARCRRWQVLPGRTHPLMTGRGGSEGYIFTATRVIPAQGKIEARGRNKRRRLDGGEVVGTP